MAGRCLAFVADAAQHQAFRDTASVPADALVVSGDFMTLYREAQAGHRVVSLWDFLDGKDIERNLDQTWALCETLAKDCSGELVWRGCDLVEVTCNDLYAALFAALNAHAAVRRCFDEHQPEHVVHFSEMRSAVYWEPPDPPPDIFNAVVAREAERRGVETLTLHLQVETSDLHAPSSAAEREHSGERPAWLSRSVHALSVCDYLGFIEQEELLRSSAHQSSGVLVVTDARAARGMPCVTTSALRGLPFNQTELCRKVAQFMDGPFHEFLNTQRAAVPSVFDNPHLRFVWEAFSGWLKRSGAAADTALFLREAVCPHIVTVDYDVFGPVRAVAKVFQQEGIPVVSVDHVGIGLSWSPRKNRGAKAHIALWGHYDEEDQRACRAPSMVRATGSLRRDLERLNRSPTSKPEVPTEKHTSRLVFFAGQNCFGPLMWAYATPDRLQHTWRNLIKVIERHRDWEFVIKPHPRYDYSELYQEVVEQSDGRARVMRGNSSDALKNADVAILVNVPSTVVFDCIFQGVPVVYLKDAILPEVTTPIEDGGACVADSVEEMEHLSTRLLADPAFREDALKAAQAFRSRALVATGKQAVDNMLVLQRDILASVGKKTRDADPAARWVLELIMLIEYRQNGEVGAGQGRERLRRLAREGRALSFEKLVYFRTDRVGRFFLQKATRGPWAPGTTASMTRLTWQVLRALPRKIRPSFGELRKCFADSLLHDATRCLDRPPVSFGYGCLATVLAPGRLWRDQGVKTAPSTSSMQPGRGRTS